MVILSRQGFLCRDRSFFGSFTLCPTTYVILSILCHDILMCVYWNNYVATLTMCCDIVSVQLLQNCVVTQFLCHDSISVSSCCNNVSYIVNIPVATRKVCRDKVLSPLNLISYCSFIFMLQHSILVLYMFYVVT